MSQHTPSKRFYTDTSGNVIILKPGDKLENFIPTGHQEPDQAWPRTARLIIPPRPAPEKKKDPRTFIGWALKAFFD